MPELPEVQTVVSSLSDMLEGKKIYTVDFTDRGNSMITSKHSPISIQKNLNFEDIISIQRIGKFIEFNLQNYSIYIHLRMTGTFYYSRDLPQKLGPDLINEEVNNSNLNNYLQFSIHLSDNSKLYFYDKRRFATFHLVDKDERYNSLDNIGPDALSVDFNYSYLGNIFNSRTKNVYSALLDQSIVAGIGNIYANEILFASRIHPLKSVSNLVKSDHKKIVFNTKKILRNAIELQGTSFSDYANITGKKGRFQEFLKVYQQKSVAIEATSKKYKVIREKYGGRSIFYVPELQIL